MAGKYGYHNGDKYWNVRDGEGQFAKGAGSLIKKIADLKLPAITGNYTAVEKKNLRAQRRKLGQKMIDNGHPPAKIKEALSADPKSWPALKDIKTYSASEKPKAPAGMTPAPELKKSLDELKANKLKADQAIIADKLKKSQAGKVATKPKPQAKPGDSLTPAEQKAVFEQASDIQPVQLEGKTTSTATLAEKIKMYQMLYGKGSVKYKMALKIQGMDPKNDSPTGLKGIPQYEAIKAKVPDSLKFQAVMLNHDNLDVQEESKAPWGLITDPTIAAHKIRNELDGGPVDKIEALMSMGFDEHLAESFVYKKKVEAKTWAQKTQASPPPPPTPDAVSSTPLTVAGLKLPTIEGEGLTAIDKKKLRSKRRTIAQAMIDNGYPASVIKADLGSNPDNWPDLADIKKAGPIKAKTAPSPESVSVKATAKKKPSSGTPETPIAKTTPNIPSSDSLKIDTTGWEKTGGKLGSNEGGSYTDPDGTQYYVKTPKTVDHAKQEVLANAFYAALGVDTPEVKLGEKGQVVSKLLVGSKTITTSGAKAKAKAKLQENFAVDVLLSNWDVGGVGWSNILNNKDGNPVRIDSGGSLMYRAQGAPKGIAFNGEANEFETLRNKYQNPTGSQIFGSMTNSQIKASAKKLEASLSHSAIDDLVNSVYPEGHPKLSNTLKKRYDSIIKKGNALPDNEEVGTPAPPNPATLNSPVFPKGKTGEIQMEYAEAYYKSPDAAAAYNQLPPEQQKQIDAMGGQSKIQEKFASTPWALGENTPKYSKASETAQKSLKSYTSTLYGPLNDSLRKGKTDELSESHKKHMAKISEALDNSVSTQDLLVVRGVSKTKAMFETLGISKSYGLPNTLEALRARIGTTIVDEGFMSTSYQNEGVTSGQAGFVGSSKINFRILAPKGSKMMNIKPISNFQSENEVLMQKGTQLTLTGVYMDAVSKMLWVDMVAEN